MLLEDLGFKTFSARRFNQDPLENLFGHIRQNGCRRVNPTSPQFISGLKSLILNQFQAPGLSKFNREAGGLEAGIQSVKNIIDGADNAETLENQNVLAIPDISLENFHFFGV